MLAYTITGFVNGDTPAVISGSPLETTPAAQGSPVGFYPINISVGSLSAGNYSFVFSTAELTITRATLAVTPHPASKTYGQSEPAFTYTISGLVNHDTASAYSGTPQLTTTATIHSPAGSYPITSALGSLISKNYAFSFLAGALTVTRATLTITPNNAFSTYGSAPPAFGYEIAGFRNGDTSSVITGAPVLATIASAASPVGSYSITANTSAMSATNYSFTAASGKLTINPAVLKVTAVNASITQGQPIPPLTYTISGFVNGDSKKAVSGSPSLSTGATTSSPVGTYPISVAAGTLSAANYTFSLVNGTLKITPP